jgi:hypothetical protein
MAVVFVACMGAEVVTDCASNNANLRSEIVGLSGRCHVY